MEVSILLNKLIYKTSSNFLLRWACLGIPHLCRVSKVDIEPNLVRWAILMPTSWNFADANSLSLDSGVTLDINAGPKQLANHKQGRGQPYCNSIRQNPQFFSLSGTKEIQLRHDKPENPFSASHIYRPC